MVLSIEKCFWWWWGDPTNHQPLIVRLLGTGGRTVFVLYRVWGPMRVEVIKTRTGLTVGGPPGLQLFSASTESCLRPGTVLGFPQP